MDNRVKGFALQALRRASLRWKPRGDALRAAKVDKGKYTCNICKEIHRHKDIQLDHILPVVPVTGWDSLDAVAERLLCWQDGYQVLCRVCHTKKSNEENLNRPKSVRKKKEKPNADLDEKRKKG